MMLVKLIKIEFYRGKNYEWTYKELARQPLYIDDIVVYLKDGCKFIGQITGLDTKVKIRRLSPPDVFVTPKETQDYGEVIINPDEVVGIIISKHRVF